MELVADITPETAVTPETRVADLRWHEVDDQFWTASDRGNHVGVIEFAEGRFRVIDAVGSTIGRSHSLGGARDLLAASLDPDYRPATPESEFGVAAGIHLNLTGAHVVALITLTVSTIAALGLGAGLLS